MSKFLYHTSCPKCGSKDNLGVWDDEHTFCFGCGYFTSGKTNIHSIYKDNVNIEEDTRSFPSDAGKDFSKEAILWLDSCHLYDKSDVFWSPSQELVCWKIKSIHGEDIGWQGRCFKPGHKTKYISHGYIHRELSTLPKDDNKQCVVLCEDYISALRINFFVPVQPLYGCTISNELLMGLLCYFTHVYVWLDSDKLDNARKIAQNINMMGKQAQVIYTPKDPKNYTNQIISQILTDTGTIIEEREDQHGNICS